jgi:Fe2+ transport system protein B
MRAPTVWKDLRMKIAAALIFALFLHSPVFPQSKPITVAELAAYNKPEFKRWYAEQGMTVEQYEKENSKWEKLLRDIGRK